MWQHDDVELHECDKYRGDNIHRRHHGSLWIWADKVLLQLGRGGLSHQDNCIKYTESLTHKKKKKKKVENWLSTSHDLNQIEYLLGHGLR